MPETILPGTYITVRDEGLITAGQVATGNIGIVGTAAKGPTNKVQILSSFSEAKEIFGSKGNWNADGGNPLTLIRALEQVFNNGGSKVYAVRTADSDSAKAAKFKTLKLADNTLLLELEALTPGTWGNDFVIKISDSAVNAVFSEEIMIDSDPPKLTRGNIDLDGSNVIKVKKNDTGQILPFTIVGTVDAVDEVSIDAVTGGLTFFNTDPDDSNTPNAEDTIIAIYEVKASLIEIRYQSINESYVVADAGHLALQLQQFSNLIRPSFNGQDTAATFINERLANTTGEETFADGNDGAGATADDYASGLSYLENEIINIVLLAGQDASNAEVLTKLQGHIEMTAPIQRERIGIIGSDATTDDSIILDQVSVINSDRIIFVAPGIAVSNLETLPGAYTAAAVAGLIASLPVQASPTNKVLNIPGLAVEFNRAKLERLIQNRVLAIEKREGYRVVKGITTATNSAWHQVTTRRIVDFAKYGVRSACNPYIGKLNNERVRGAMRATIDAFLTRMVEDEALTGYELDVTATRPQEIAGEAIVTLVLFPTFSIDFIRVTMYLQ